MSLKAEKLTIEETTERNIQLQTAKLNELLVNILEFSHFSFSKLMLLFIKAN